MRNKFDTDPLSLLFGECKTHPKKNKDDTNTPTQPNGRMTPDAK
jgi:hypothetical protein